MAVSRTKKTSEPKKDLMDFEEDIVAQMSGGGSVRAS